MAFSNEFKLKYVIDADGKKARSELDSVETKIAKLGGTISKTAGLSATQLNAVALGAGAVAAGIVAVGAAAVAATRFILDLAKEAADFGSIIYDASQKTGLTAETLSALKFGADQAGSSFEQVTKGIKAFGIEVGKAAAGDEEAAKKMADLKVTSQDLDTALGQVFKTIFEGKSDVDKLRLANEAFGKKIGPDLIPLIKDSRGNLEEFIKTAKRLGITIDDEAARAADEFDDTLQQLGTQVTALGRQIASPLIPRITELSKALSQLLVDNQQALTNWQKHTSLIFDGVIGYWEDLRKKVEEYNAEVGKSGSFGGFPGGRGFGGPIGLSPSQSQPIINRGIDLLTQRGQQRQTMNSNIVRDTPSIFSFPDPLKSAEDADKAQREAEKRAKEREDIARRDAAAQVQILNKQLDDVQKVFYTKADEIRDKLKETGDVEVFNRTLENINRIYVAEAGEILRLLDAAEKAADESAKKTDKEQELREVNRLARVRALNEEIVKDKQKSDQVIAELGKKQIEDTKKAREEELKDFEDSMEIQSRRMVELNEREHDRLEILEKQTEEIRQQYKADRDENLFKNTPQLQRSSGDVFLDALLSGDLALEMDNFTNSADYLKGTFTSIGDIANDAFGQVANGIGSMVEAWVIYGTAGPDAMKKMVASVLAGVAAQSAVLAIFELAKGFAALFFNPAEAAAHFTSAALFGSIAVGTALAGRAVAGKSFAAGGGSRSPSQVSGSGSGSGRDDTTPISRVSAGAYDSGPRSGNPIAKMVTDLLGPHLHDLANATREHTDVMRQYSKARPGDVLQAGMRERRGVVTQQVIGDMKSNSSYSRQMKRVSGDR